MQFYPITIPIDNPNGWYVMAIPRTAVPAKPPRAQRIKRLARCLQQVDTMQEKPPQIHSATEMAVCIDNIVEHWCTFSEMTNPLEATVRTYEQGTTLCIGIHLMFYDNALRSLFEQSPNPLTVENLWQWKNKEENYAQ